MKPALVLFAITAVFAGAAYLTAAVVLHRALNLHYHR